MTNGTDFALQVSSSVLIETFLVSKRLGTDSTKKCSFFGVICFMFLKSICGSELLVTLIAQKVTIMFFGVILKAAYGNKSFGAYITNKANTFVSFLVIPQLRIINKRL